MASQFSVRTIFALCAVACLAACSGGLKGSGTSFTPNAWQNGAVHSPSTETLVYDLQKAGDGIGPVAGFRDSQGNFFGTTYAGGGAVRGKNAFGTLFELVVSGSTYTHKLLHRFAKDTIGTIPGPVVSDASGNIFGLASNGVYEVLRTNLQAAQQIYHCSRGSNSSARLTIAQTNIYGVCGQTVFELTPQGSSYTEKTLHVFTNDANGSIPNGDLLVDESGNVFGTTLSGGSATGGGVVYELTASTGYQETVLYTFQGNNLGTSKDGYMPGGGVYRDSTGALYGTTEYGGINNGNSSTGTFYQLAPNGSGGYVENIIDQSTNLYTPDGTPVADASGNFYFSTVEGLKNGDIIKLSPSGSSYTETVLFAFVNGAGVYPDGPLILDTSGAIYGATQQGGSAANGVVYKLGP